MVTSTLALLLQLSAAMLTGVQHNPSISPAVAEQTIAIASHAIQLDVQTQVMPNISFPFPKDDSNVPTVKDLSQTAYVDANGKYVPQGSDVALVPEDTSFGDINQDGLDDAAAIVQRTDLNGNTTVALAAMLNQDGILFNIADVQLGTNVQIFSHNVVQGGDIVLNMQADNQPLETSTYYLLGDQLFKE